MLVPVGSLPFAVGRVKALDNMIAKLDAILVVVIMDVVALVPLPNMCWIVESANIELHIRNAILRSFYGCLVGFLSGLPILNSNAG